MEENKHQSENRITPQEWKQISDWQEDRQTDPEFIKHLLHQDIKYTRMSPLERLLIVFIIALRYIVLPFTAGIAAVWVCNSMNLPQVVSAAAFLPVSYTTHLLLKD